MGRILSFLLYSSCTGTARFLMGPRGRFSPRFFVPDATFFYWTVGTHLLMDMGGVGFYINLQTFVFIWIGAPPYNNEGSKISSLGVFCSEFIFVQVEPLTHTVPGRRSGRLGLPGLDMLWLHDWEVGNIRRFQNGRSRLTGLTIGRGSAPGALSIVAARLPMSARVHTLICGCVRWAAAGQ